jgi:hypothetical protein
MNIYWKLSGYCYQLAKAIERVGMYFFMKAIEKKQKEASSETSDAGEDK